MNWLCNRTGDAAEDRCHSMGCAVLVVDPDEWRRVQAVLDAARAWIFSSHANDLTALVESVRALDAAGEAAGQDGARVRRTHPGLRTGENWG